MSAKKLFAALLAVAMVGSLAACGGNSGKSGGNSAQSSGTSKLDADQIYTISLDSDPSTIDPSKCNDIYGGAILTNTMEPLTRVEQQKDGSNKVAPAAAKSWESNADGTVWTFHLRDNHWSDGQKVTAKDYAYGISRILNPKTGSPLAYMLVSIKNANAVNGGKMAVDQLGVKAVDDNTLQITLESSTPYFLALTYSNAMYPCRQDYVEKYGEKYGSEANTLVACGPFKVKSWTHNSEIILVKNNDYWDKKTVKLTTVDYKILADENSLYNSFDNGTVESVGCGTPEWIKRFKAKDNVQYTHYVTPSIRFHFYNTKDKLFKNVNIRKAFTLAVNRDDVVDTIYHKTMATTYSWVPVGVSTGSLGDFRKQVGVEPLKQLKDENKDPKALLLQGMKELNLGDDPSKLKITFSMGGTTQWLRNYGEYLQQVFKKNLGVTIDLDYNEWPTFQSKINHGDYQMGYMSWGIDYDDPMAMLGLMTSDANSIPTGWKNEKYDALVKQASSEMDEAKRVQLYKQAEEIVLHDDCVLAPIVNETVNRFTYKYVKNQSTNYFASNSSGLKYIYISGRNK